MKTPVFQDTIVRGVENELARNGTALPAIRALAEDALALSEAHPDDIPPDALAEFARKHPLAAIVLKEEVRAGEAERSEKRIENLRNIIKKLSS